MIFTERVHRFLRRVARAYLDDHIVMDPPTFYEDMITQFANAYPQATRSDWKHFALVVSLNAFGDGFERGKEHQETIDTSIPDDISNQIDRNWRDSPPVDLENPDAIVPEEVPSEGIMTDDFIRRITR